MKKFFLSERLIPFIIALAFFMEAVDSTILNTAIPVMSKSLSVNPVDLKIALISYLLSLAIFIPISGWLADKFGAKKIFIGSLILFTLSSLWCGLVHHLTELMIARFIQGFASAFGMPVGRLIIVRTFGRENLISTMSHVVIIGALGMMLGPVIGGIITHYFSWQWIFWVNIPIGLGASILAIILLPPMPPQRPQRLDKIGFILFGTGLASFTFGLSALSETTFNFHLAIEIISTSFILFLLYIMHSLRIKKDIHPIVRIDLFYLKTFKISVIGNLFTRIGFGGIPFLIPLLLQIELGFSPQLSGILLAPMALGVLSVKSVVLPILRKLRYKKLLILNTCLAGISIWTFIIIHQSTPIYVIGFLMFLYGFIISLQYSSMNSLAYADVPSEHLSAATSIMGTLQQLSQSFGLAISAIFIRIFSYLHPKHPLTLHIFHQTFFTIGLITIFSSFIFSYLKKTDGNQMFLQT